MNVFSILCMIVAAFTFAGEKTGAKTFGTMEPASARQVSLTEAMKGYDKYKGQNILMVGTVKKVCQMSGCWFEMADGAEKVRITMKDYGFTVPKDIVDKPVKVVGLLEQKELPVKVVKHYMKDEGLPQSEIDKVKEPKKVFEFVA
ncbi:DUF4920 domain-containing protein, partial [bacterium]|nr:DUF4920 domain-containing protein [bacterium]